MRITEARMVEVAAQNMVKARSAVADAGDEVSTGLRVERPSDDPTGWASGRRAAAISRASEARGTAIAGAQERLSETEGALNSIGQALVRAKELAVQASSAFYSAEERANMALEVRSLRDSVLSAANLRGTNGEYLFSGSQGDVPPFDATGTYVGDGYQRSIETAAGDTQIVTVPGSRLTAAGGVDLLGELQALADALAANDLTGIQTAMGAVDTAVGQVSRARTEIGALSSSLQIADDNRRGLELVIEEIQQRATAADPIESASRLTQAATALETAQVLTNKIVDITRPR